MGWGQGGQRGERQLHMRYWVPGCSYLRLSTSNAHPDAGPHKSGAQDGTALGVAGTRRKLLPGGAC